MIAWLCSLHFTWGFLHPVRGWFPRVEKRQCGLLPGSGQAWTALTLRKPGLPTSRLWAHYSVAAGFFSSMACGLCEAEVGPLIPRLGVSQGHWGIMGMVWAQPRIVGTVWWIDKANCHAGVLWV